ncbi:homing endonuclease [Xanthomonas phage CP1]|uniref:GIY-YIG domain-containing protein n=1 Tax=Xanthomonas phage CP1 TaxID=2994055 RepID=I7HDH7_9CAUD|nr:homing endonuclease [Xanthomonas phage CP1]BAM29075.1 hypothetical protein [Xanthomonas phage CP1]
MRRGVTGIYAITSPSGRRYVGQAVCIRARWRKHLSNLHRDQHHNPLLTNAFRKYGDALVFSVIEECLAEDLTAREQFHMDQTPPSMLLNVCPAAGSPLGMKRSPETRARMSAATKGKAKSTEHRAKLAAANKGKTLPAEQCAKIAEALRGRVHSAEARTKQAEAVRGKMLPNNTSGFCGVRRNGTGWQAKLGLLGSSVYFPTRPSPEAAWALRENFLRILYYYDHS